MRTSLWVSTHSCVAKGPGQRAWFVDANTRSDGTSPETPVPRPRTASVQRGFPDGPKAIVLKGDRTKLGRPAQARSSLQSWQRIGLFGLLPLFHVTVGVPTVRRDVPIRRGAAHPAMHRGVLRSPECFGWVC